MQVLAEDKAQTVAKTSLILRFSFRRSAAVSRCSAAVIAAVIPQKREPFQSFEQVSQKKEHAKERAQAIRSQLRDQKRRAEKRSAFRHKASADASWRNALTLFRPTFARTLSEVEKGRLV